MKKILLFPIEYLWIAVVLVCTFAFISTHPIRPHDFWFHLNAGREIITTGQIPLVDTNSFTAYGTPYPSYQNFWLMDALFYLIYRAGGPALIVFFQSLAITGAYSMIMVCSWRATHNHRATAFATIFAAFLGFSGWNVRPQVAAIFLGSIFILALSELIRHGNKIWLIVFPFGMAVWVNSHGTFPIGFALVGIWLVAEVWRKIKQPGVSNLNAAIWALILTALGSLANPVGIGVIHYITGMLSSSVIQELVPEWAPPDIETMQGLLFYAGLLFTSTILAISPKRPNLFQLMLFLTFTILGLKTQRGSLWFGLTMAPVVAVHLTAIMADSKSAEEIESQPGSPLLNGIVIFVLAGMLLLSLPWLKNRLPFPASKAGLLSSETPVYATQALLDNQWSGNIFNAMSFGGYLGWAAQPDYPIYTDARIELYPPEVWHDYIYISAARPGWDARLAEYDIKTLILSPTDQPSLIEAATNSPTWEKVFTSDAAVIFTASSP